MHKNYPAEFLDCISDILVNEHVLAMKEISQHNEDTNCFEHSIYVAYTSYMVCKKLRLDARSAARGAMLHDFHLCKWGECGISQFKGVFKHPEIAMKNAEEHFGVSAVERDIIAKHMWPLTPFKIPKYRESVVVNFVDTYCATLEFMGLHKKKEKSPAIG